jgi:hypothetical protein
MTRRAGPSGGRRALKSLRIEAVMRKRACGVGQGIAAPFLDAHDPLVLRVHTLAAKPLPEPVATHMK